MLRAAMKAAISVGFLASVPLFGAEIRFQNYEGPPETQMFRLRARLPG